MTPHFGLSESENNQTSVDPERVPFLRPISQSWSQFRGPSRNGLIPPQRFSLDFSKPPALRWVKNCGPGHSSIVTEGELVITLEQNNQYETLSARSLDNGDEVWQRVEKTSWNDYFSGEGPRSTPTIADGKIFALFSNGILSCVNAKDGNSLWSIPIVGKEFEFPEWGFAFAPLIWNDLIILNPGGDRGAVKAYSKLNGKLVWESEFAGKGVYLSPSIHSFLGEMHLLVAVEGKIASLDPENGKTRWEMPWKIFLNDVQIVQPISLSEDSFLIAAGYGKGAECFKVIRDQENGSYRIESVWKSKNLKAKFSNPVLKDGYLYGLSENLLVCLEAETGRLIWRGKKYGYGRILICQERLLILGNTGVLSVVEASPKKFTEIFSEQLLNRSRCWNGPAIVDGYLIARNGEQIACFDTAVSP